MSGAIAYLLPHAPRPSETFIADEIDALARRGTPIEVYALLPATRGRGLVAGIPATVGAQLYWLARAPRRLLAIWATALVHHARSPALLARAILGVCGAARFAIRMQRRGVGHVHAHFATHSALAAWAIRRLTGLPYSFTAHADDIFVRRPMLAEKVAGASFVVAISEFNRRLLADQLGESAARNVRVVRCGVSPGEFGPLPPAAPDAPYTILCVGRLEPKKGQRILIEACRRLLARGIDFRCWIVGDGRERANLERARDAARLGDRVALLGSLSRAQIRDRFAQAHVFALPSVAAADGRCDGVPVALIEAMMLERPVVSTRLSGIPELVEDGDSGLLVASGDAAALADALEQIYRDPALAARMAREASRRAREGFDLGRNVAALERLFADARRGAPEPAVLTKPIPAPVELGETGS